MRPTIKLAILCVLVLMFGACAGRQIRVQTMPVPTKSGVVLADVVPAHEALVIDPSAIVTSLDLPKSDASSAPIEADEPVVSPVPVEALASVKTSASKIASRTTRHAAASIDENRVARHRTVHDPIRPPKTEPQVERQDSNDSMAAGPPAPSIYPPPRERPRSMAPAGFNRTNAPSISQTPPNGGRSGPSPSVLIAFLLVFIGALAAVALDLRGRIRDNNRYNEMQSHDETADKPPMEPVPPVQPDPHPVTAPSAPSSTDTHHPALARHINGMVNNAPCSNQVAGTIGATDPSLPKSNSVPIEFHDRSQAPPARPVLVPPGSPTTFN